jgi:hypothetical protein
MLRCLEGDRSPRILANQLLWYCFDPFQVKMRACLRDKTGHCIGTVLVSNMADYLPLALQELLFSLYCVIRSVRSSGRYSQRLFGCVLR